MNVVFLGVWILPPLIVLFSTLLVLAGFWMLLPAARRFDIHADVRRRLFSPLPTAALVRLRPVHMPMDDGDSASSLSRAPPSTVNADGAVALLPAAAEAARGGRSALRVRPSSDLR